MKQLLVLGFFGLTLSVYGGEEKLSYSSTSSTSFPQNLDTGLRQSPGIEIVEDGGSIIAIQPAALTTQSREVSPNSSFKSLMKRCASQQPVEKADAGPYDDDPDDEDGDSDDEDVIQMEDDDSDSNSD